MMRAVVYDAVGTLIHVAPSAAAVYGAVGRRHGSRRSDAEIAARFGAALAAQDRVDFADRWQTSEARERARWQAVVGEVLDDVGDPQACFEELFAHFAQPSAWRIEPDVAETLLALRGRGIVQAVASNFDARLAPLVAAMPAFEDRISRVFVSSQIGWRKPARAFFEHVLDGLRLPGDAVVYVGDEPEIDVAAAGAAGLHAVLFDPKGKRPDLGPHRIERLAELPAWLDRAARHGL